MEKNNNSYCEWYLFDYPADGEEAMRKWLALSKAIQLLKIIYEIPDEKIEKAIALSIEE